MNEKELKYILAKCNDEQKAEIKQMALDIQKANHELEKWKRIKEARYNRLHNFLKNGIKEEL